MDEIPHILLFRFNYILLYSTIHYFRMGFALRHVKHYALCIVLLGKKRMPKFKRERRSQGDPSSISIHWPDNPHSNCCVR